MSLSTTLLEYLTPVYDRGPYEFDNRAFTPEQMDEYAAEYGTAVGLLAA